jgi:RNA polymerase sigma-70 factor (ECF subfamily)
MQESSQYAYEMLFRQHNHALCNLAYNLLRDKDAAKDVVQEVFLKLWKNKDTLVFGDQIKHYLFRATAHTAMNHIRFNKKIVRMDATDETLLNVRASSDSHEVGYKELELRVREAIDRLPARCKAIYILSRQEGLKYQEIADALNLSIKTVENQMGIALEKLRNDLKPFLSPEFLVIAILLASLLYSILY